MTEIALGSLLLTGLVLLLALMVIGARAVLSPSRPATITVNGATRIATRTGDKLLSALTDGGVLVPSACAGAGTCGLCKVRVTEGGGEALPTEAARLSKADLRGGMRLACQMVVRDDMHVEVDEDLIGAETFICKVRSVRSLSPLIREVVLDLPEGMAPQITAGSFFQITAPPFVSSFADLAIPAEHLAVWKDLRALGVKSDVPVTRAYSISNRPEDTAAGRIVLNIRLALPPPSLPDAPPGVVSTWAFGLKAGDGVETSGPFGSFRAQDTEAEMVFIGGGVGMAPLRAIMLDQLGRVGTKRRMSFWYGARDKGELFYQSDFDQLAAAHPNFRWTVALSDPRPEDDWQGATGFVHAVASEAYLKSHPAPEACEYYLCGPPMMIRAVLAMLDDLGVDKSQIFNDDFGV